MGNDSFCKAIFKSGRNEIIHIINYFYKTNYKPDEVEIEFLDKESILFDKNKEELIKRESDYVISITHQISKQGNINKFKVEFQSAYDKFMVHRSLIYDILNAQIEEKRGLLKMTRPESLVIYPIEFHAKNEITSLELCNQFGKLELHYKLNLLKLWELNIDKMDEHHLEILYPLKILNSKQKLINKKIGIREYTSEIELYMKKFTSLFDNRIRRECDIMMATEALAQVVMEDEDKEFREYIHNTYFKPYIDSNNRARSEGREEGREETKNNMIFQMFKYNQPKENIIQIAEIDEQEYEAMHKKYLSMVKENSEKYQI